MDPSSTCTSVKGGPSLPPKRPSSPAGLWKSVRSRTTWPTSCKRHKGRPSQGWGCLLVGVGTQCQGTVRLLDLVLAGAGDSPDLDGGVPATAKAPQQNPRASSTAAQRSWDAPSEMPKRSLANRSLSRSRKCQLELKNLGANIQIQVPDQLAHLPGTLGSGRPTTL